MSETCPTGFDQKLLSGHMDRELTQRDEQRVRIHLEDCARCRALLEDLERMREAAMMTQLTEPTDEQWDERPRGAVSRGARGMGWTLAIVWLVAVTVYGAWELASGPEALLVKLLVFGGVSGLVLLFVSVVSDRMRTAKSDRYQGVEK